MAGSAAATGDKINAASSGGCRELYELHLGSWKNHKSTLAAKMEEVNVLSSTQRAGVWGCCVRICNQETRDCQNSGMLCFFVE